MHRVIGKVTDDIGGFQLNTSIAAMMELTNAAYDYRKSVAEGSRDLPLLGQVAETLTLLLAPYVPHMAEELWSEVLGRDGSVHRAGVAGLRRVGRSCRGRADRRAGQWQGARQDRDRCGFA